MEPGPGATVDRVRVAEPALRGDEHGMSRLRSGYAGRRRRALAGRQAATIHRGLPGCGPRPWRQQEPVAGACRTPTPVRRVRVPGLRRVESRAELIMNNAGK